MSEEITKDEIPKKKPWYKKILKPTSILLIFGILDQISGFSGYNLKDDFFSKEKIEKITEESEKDKDSISVVAHKKEIEKIRSKKIIEQKNIIAGGIVFNYQSKEPIRNQKIFIDKFKTQTDDNGKFIIELSEKYSGERIEIKIVNNKYEPFSRKFNLPNDNIEIPLSLKK